MRAASKGFRVFTLYLLLSLFLILVDSWGAFSPVRQAAQVLTLPTKSSLTLMRESLLSPFVFISKGLREGEKITELEEKVASITAELAQKRALEQENEELRRLLGAPLPASWKFASARVVSWQNDLLLATGNYTAEPGTTVVLPSREGGIFVGKVKETVGREIKITFPTHEEARIPVYVKNQAGQKTATGIVLGRSGEAVVDQVLTGEALEEGYLVFTSGEGSPADLLVGEVAEVVRPEGKAWKQAKLVLSVQKVPEYVFFVTEY